MIRFIGRHPFTVLCLTMLVLTEAAAVRILTGPYASTKQDWQLTTLVIAPVTAAFLVFLTLAAGCLVRLVVKLVRGVVRILRAIR